MNDTLKFFKIAKPNPSSRDFLSQFAVHFEEFSESFEPIGSKGSELYDTLQGAISEMKEGVSSASDSELSYLIDNKIDKVALLDSLADQYVTLIGTAYTLGFDIESAIKEVEASNLSKFVYIGNRELDEYDFKRFELVCNRILVEGRYKGVHWKRIGEYVVFYDGNGKILKNPSTYFEPNLEKFI